MIGAALGRVVARLDAWKKDRASLAADIQVLANSTQERLTNLGHTAGDAFKRTRTASSPKSAKTAAATKGRPRALRKKRVARDGEIKAETQVFDQKGGDRSDRAAHSGATGERSTSGGQNKPEPRNQDEKGMGHLRNR
jgi:hypothetical protein